MTTATMNYPTTTDNAAEATTYNGWANYETWNVSLYINNEFELYSMACAFAKSRDYYKNGSVSYNNFLPFLKHSYGSQTPDGVKWDASELDRSELDEMLQELIDN